MGEDKKHKPPYKTKHPAIHKDSLSKWRTVMGYEIKDCAHELGCSQADWKAWESGAVTIPRHVGLACTALAMGMNPYGEDQN